MVCKARRQRSFVQENGCDFHNDPCNLVDGDLIRASSYKVIETELGVRADSQTAFQEDRHETEDSQCSMPSKRTPLLIASYKRVGAGDSAKQGRIALSKGRAGLITKSAFVDRHQQQFLQIVRQIVGFPCQTLRIAFKLVTKIIEAHGL